MTIKIYSVNDVDWVAGDFTAEGALAYYQSSIEYNQEDDELDPVVLSDDDLATYMFVEEDGTRRSFGAVLQDMINTNQTFPCLFASTEY